MLSFLTSFLLAAAVLQGPAPKPRPASAPKPVAPAPILWSASRPLTLADFVGHPGPSDRLAASTSSNIQAGAACRDFVFTGTVTATFDPATSWFRNPNSPTAATLLRHEQVHFDITEVYARIMRQRMLVFQGKADCNKLQPAFNNFTKGVYAEWDKEQNRYDAETNHGLNAARQAYWEKQTQVKLAQLETFAAKQ
ncbi:MAG: hypothetical protein JWR44_342 [Hymenobacter sp.]|jgi:hypothetical protein|nr:hypothetical protein [Hymenobacter sp.]